MNLSRKIILLIISTFIALVFIVAAISDVILLSSYRQIEKKNSISHIEQVYNQIHIRVEQNSVTARDIALDIGQQPLDVKGATGVAQRYLSEYNLKVHRVDLGAIYDAAGHLMVMRRIDCESGAYCSIEESQRKAISKYAEAASSGTERQMSGVVEVDGAPFMISINPIMSPEGSFRGVLLIGCFLDKVELEQLGRVTGVITQLTPIGSANLPADIILAHKELTKSGGFVSNIVDNRHVSGYAHLKDVFGNPSFIVSVIDSRVLFMQGEKSIKYILIVLVVCGTVFCSVMLVFMRGTVLNRLALLNSKVGEISLHKDISERLEVRGEDELENLAASINNMLDSLESTERALRESEERYRALFERAPDSIIIMGTEGEEAGKIIAANSAAAAQHGYSVEELCSLKIHDLNTPEANLVAGELFRRITNGEWITSELWHFRKDGSRFPIEVHAGPLKINGRNYVLGFDRDITARKLAEESDRKYLEQISQLNRELSANAYELLVANKELESFNYSVSHDMRGPLTRISGYCQLMLEDSGSLDPKIRTYLTRVYESSCWLDEMLEAMLKLSRLARAEFIPTKINLSTIVEDVIRDLSLAEPGRAIDVTIEPDVEVFGDPQMLKVLIDNLINNSWKYSAHKERTSIIFGKQNDGPSPVYFVRDKGAGFDMKDADKLFRVFTRLHDQSQFKGSGIGLATVQKVISRHGGAIWAEGEVGQGATFFFTLEPEISAMS